MAKTMVHMAITKGFLVPAPFLSLPGVVVKAHPRQPHVGVMLWRGGGCPERGTGEGPRGGRAGLA